MMENYDDLTYDILPPSWVFCFLEGCPRADECILHITSRLITKDQTFGLAVFPLSWKNQRTALTTTKMTNRNQITRRSDRRI